MRPRPKPFAALLKPFAREPAVERSQRALLVTAPLALAFHLSFSIAFAVQEVWPLVWFNVLVSLPMWACSWWLVRRWRLGIATLVNQAEVLAHSTLATAMVGWGSGFHLFLLVAAVSGPLTAGLQGQKWFMRAVGFISFMVWTGCFVVLRPIAPLYSLAPVVLDVFHYFNVVAFVVAVTGVVWGLTRAADLAEASLANELRRSEELANAELRRQVAERSRVLGQSLSLAAPSPQLPDTGTLFDGRYHVVRILGRGGMGVVFEVRRTADGRAFALKLMTGAASPEATVRFMREAEIAARLSHPNLVSVVDVGVSRGAPFLAMELVQGASLDSLEDRYGDASFALPVLRGIARGLVTLHQAGVVHRDLKPGNVLVGGTGESPEAKLTDFGIARIVEGVDPLGDTAAPGKGDPLALTGTGFTMGTPKYMAPEVVRNASGATPAVDVYAFGLFACELLARRFPFAQPPALEAAMGRPVPRPDLSALVGHRPGQELSPLIEACLDPDPARRPGAVQLVEALELVRTP